jgi:16S rRNA (cytidine1402-2'-O)-methyltransferase
VKPSPSPQSTGTLYLVPTPLDFGCEDYGEFAPLDAQLPRGTIAVAQRCHFWLTENAKSTRAFLKRVDAIAPLTQPLQSLSITEMPRQAHKKGDHHQGAGPSKTTDSWQRTFLNPALMGHDLALVSEAGMPAIADPGSSVVRTAHTLGIQVVPLNGSVSLMLALAASGLNGQSFAFNGYCAQNPDERKRHILQAQQKITQTGQTQIWIETPYRNLAFLDALLRTLLPQTHLALCAGLTLAPPLIHSASVKEWKSRAWPQQEQLSKLPCVFLIGH